jgi:hypothetical protein
MFVRILVPFQRLTVTLLQPFRQSISESNKATLSIAFVTAALSFTPILYWNKLRDLDP